LQAIRATFEIDKDDFINQQSIDNEKMADKTALEEAQQAAKLEVLNKLGLTNEQAILLGLLPPAKEEKLLGA
jgi:cyclopropane fatty-acyl-phospholipid synthase-like methyltransferase